MIVPPQREGGQSQYLAAPGAVTSSDSFAAMSDWMIDNLELEVTVADLAARADMSPRTFARRFRAEMGATPAAWLARQSVIRAQELLEESALPVDRIAVDCGFGTAAVLRQHFLRTVQVTPTAYRRIFGARKEA
jgi:transcriptional regulator GlxA family with amidase domain